MARWVLHVDLDQFVAAVEVLRRPELRDLPVVVGGRGDPTERGVVSTASYEAREFGVRSGMPLRTAARRCPDAVFLAVDRDAYDAASAQVMAVLADVATDCGGVLEVLGWDEAFLGAAVDDPERLARRIRDHVRAATELECSVGIGPNKLLAKTATGFAKPAGVHRLTREGWTAQIGPRAPDAVWGIGSRTVRRLAGLGIGTVAELAATDPAEVAAAFGPATGPWLVARAQGRDPSPVVGTPWRARSRSREKTFQADLTSWADVENAVREVALRVAKDVEAEGRPAVRVVVKVRFAPFETVTHGVPLASPSADASVLTGAAAQALSRFTPGRPVRLVGVRAELADRAADATADAAPRDRAPADPAHTDPEVSPSDVR